MRKKGFLIIIIICFLFAFISPVAVHAHSSLLDVTYDPCAPNYYDDGDDEMWYYLNRQYSGKTYNVHLPQTTTVIKYYFAATARDDTSYTWTTDVTNDIASEIRSAIVNSMVKWNNIVYYSYDINGIRQTHNIITIQEGTLEDHNLTIYPIRYCDDIDDSNDVTYFAATGWTNDGTVINTGDPDIYHYHINQWYMLINVSLFYEHDAITHTPSIYSVPSTSKDNVSIVRNRTGEHEIGHILGLYDVDECCSASTIQHHEELLMGYGFMSGRSQDVNYKDISGVAITRGFHSDNDHRWMKRVNVDGTIDMICSICNGVRKNVTLDSGEETYEGKAFVDYQDCRHHGHSNSNMLLVAADGMRKFYKCMYCRHIIIVENSYNIGNYSSEINISTNIKHRNNSSVFFELNSQYNKKYEIIANATNTIDLKLYDEYFNLISTLDINASSQIEHIINNLNIGKYYLEIENLSTTNIDLSIIILSRTSAYLSYNTQNNILLNTYNGIHDYFYINDRGPGFYKFKLTGTNIDGTTFIYPANAIKIYNDTPKTASTLLEKYSLTGYTNHAQNKYNEDSFIVCLPRNGYFYIDVNMSYNSLLSLELCIESVDSNTINLFDLSEPISEEVEIFDENIKGDYFERLDLKQTGKFEIEVTYDGLSTNDILFVLAKRIYNSSTNTYSLETKCIGLLNDTNDTYSSTKNLEDGTYYIGYFNKNDNSNINVTFNRLITQFGSQYLVADPDIYSLHGSETRFNNGAYQGNRLTIGFTRFLFINNTLDIPSQYTQDYYLYSSNESIATISQYGTILGLSPGTTKIMAVYKTNPSIVYVKEFTVVDEVREDDLVIINTDNIGYAESEQMYYISLTDTNSFFPQLSLYNWSVVNSENNYHYSISMWGTFSMNGADVITIEGRSTINSKLVIRLVLTVN